MTSMLKDFRYAVRQARRQPALSSVVVLTVALGVGAATTAFSILDTITWRSPPYPFIDRLAALYASAPADGQGRYPLAASLLTDVQDSGQFDALVAYAPQGFNAVSSASTARVSGAAISGDLFGLLGARLVGGRAFTASEFAEALPVAVVSESLGARLYDGVQPALHSTIYLDGLPHVIVGITAGDFTFPGGTHVWVPLAAGAAASAPQVWAVGRVRQMVTVQQVDASLAGMAAATNGTPGADRVIRAMSLRDSMISPKHQAAATVLLVASAIVLLLACVNLAGLVLASLTARRTELALRAAIGAKRLRIVRLVMVENLALAMVGGMIGIALAAWGVHLFLGALGTPVGAEWLEFGLRWRAVAFAIGLSLLTSLIVSLLPAMSASRADLRSMLVEGSGQASGGPGGRHRRLMAVVQVAVSLALVVAASSVVASSIGLDKAPTGFDPLGLLGARVSLSGGAYEDASARVALLDRVQEALTALPGVVGVSVASHVPIIDRRMPRGRVHVDPSADEAAQPTASIWHTAGNYLETMGIPLVRGRSFSSAESRDPLARVALINESMARRYWPDGDPLGRQIQMRGDDDTLNGMTVIGVVADVGQKLALPVPGETGEPQPDQENQVYLPVVHARDVSFVIRASDVAAVTPEVQRVIGGVDAALPVATQTMSAAYQWYVWDRRAQGLVLGGLGSVALALAALGVFGVMSLMVAHRRREIGVRIAIGSTPSAIRRLVLAASLRLTASGLLWGLLLGVAATTGLSAIFLGVRPFDVRVFVAASGLLCTVGVVAAWWPARQAMAVDPMSILKSDRS